MPSRGLVTDKWDFKDSHLDPTIDSADSNKFLSAARCILYTKPASKNGTSADDEFTRVGVVQGYSWGETKQMEMVFELGSDIPYFIPGRTTGQINIQKILLSGEDFLNLTYQPGSSTAQQSNPSNWIRSLRDINIPLDLMFVFYGQGADGEGSSQAYTDKYARLFKNAWIQSRQESISAGQILVAESVSILYEFVASYTFAS